MWTPRRVLLLLAGLFGFGAAYAGYAHVLGGLDGLPQLPARFLTRADGDGKVTVAPVAELATTSKLKEAFGPNCAEQNRTVYPLQIELGAEGIVFAAGSPPALKEPTQFIRLAPFSVAVFAKPRPKHEQVLGEVTEVSTIHADEAVLELDHKVADTKELLTGKAKIVGMELRAAADTRFAGDHRAGRVVIRNNQRLADPNRAFEFRTPGPVFYRSPDHPDMADGKSPHVTTRAAVEVVNKDNLPRPVRGAGVPAVPAALDAGVPRPNEVVADMALGLRAPPPTMTADGMRIFLKPDKTPPKPGDKGKRGPAFSGVRELILDENVVFHLWTDGGGFPGSAPADGKPVARPDVPLGLTAVAGGGPDGRTAAERLGRSLVVIRTLGPFRYNWDTNAARFDIAPNANPHLPNHVELTRFAPLGGQDLLISQLLEIEFAGPIAAGGPPPPPKKPGEKAPTGPAFKSLKATGLHVYLSASAEQLQAQGTALEYTSDPAKGATRTTLRGAPLRVVRAGNRLQAGTEAAAGHLVLDAIDPPPGVKGATKKTTLDVFGPGSVEVYDEAAKAVTLRAGWTESLRQSKDKLGDREVDLLVFAGRGEMVDPKGTFRLAADTLKLWLGDPPKKPGEKAGQPLPARLVGVGNVSGRSEDAIIHDTDLLNVWFKDTAKSIRTPATPPAPLPAVAAAPQVPAGPAAPQPVPFLEPVATVPPRENPMHLSARSIEVTLSRFPAPPTGMNPAARKPEPQGAVQYEVADARCDGRVIAHQDAAEPLRSPRGMDIASAALKLENRPAGYAVEVTGTADLLAEVYYERTFIAGPVVKLDQPNNRVRVDGRGTLRMPSSSDLTGTPTADTGELTVDWIDWMEFSGEKRSARFLGRVQARQANPDRTPVRQAAGPAAEVEASRSWVLCHDLQVTFDREVYFNQMRPADRKGSAKRDANAKGPHPDDPKVERVVCAPLPDDANAAAGKPPVAQLVSFGEETFARRTGRLLKAQQIASRHLEVQVQEKESRNVVIATGPGESRTLQLGNKEQQPGGPPPAADKPPEQEMKLTVVRFRDRLEIDDRKGVFQLARFRGRVQAVQTPSDVLHLTLKDETPLPPRSTLLKADDEMLLSSYRGQASAEPTRTMHASGNAFVRTDDYDGRGQDIEYDGTMIVLKGYDGRQASLHRRNRPVDGQDFQTGNPIKYNTKTGKVDFENSSGGAFSSPGK